MKPISYLMLAVCLLAAAARAQSPVTVTVTNSPGYAIPDDYAGLSFGAVAELPNHKGVSGHLFCATNTQLVTLFKNSGIHNLRLGGSTVEGIHAAKPDRAAIDSVFDFARAAGVKVIYSLPLLNGNSATDAVTAEYIWKRYRPLLSYFAIGNEPDIKRYHFPPFGTGTDPDITNYTTFLKKWRQFATVVSRAVPGAKFVGPDAAGRVWAGRFAKDEKDSGIVSLITAHYYVGGRPDNTTIQQAIDRMLSARWVDRNYPARYESAIAPVVAEGLPYRMTESNDYLKGIAGASDSFASALWALDYLHWWVARGCKGVNFHNTEWLKTDTVYFDASSRSCQINPKAYGIKAFDLGSHGRVEPIEIGNPDGLDLTAYAVGSTTNLCVTIINKEHGAGAREAAVTIEPVGFSERAAAVMFLTAPNGNVGAMSGITLGGAAITNNGPWRGKWTSLSSTKPARWMVNVPVTSAAVVKISTR